MGEVQSLLIFSPGMEDGRGGASSGEAPWGGTGLSQALSGAFTANLHEPPAVHLTQPYAGRQTTKHARMHTHTHKL